VKIRKIASLTAALSFIVMLLTNIILYIVPQGRIAYWADWRLWNLTKEQWGNIHINTGILLLTALGFHIYYNWKPILSYLKDAELSSLKTFTKKMGLDLKESMSLLKEAEFTIEGEMQTLSAIGKLNNVSPQQIYLTIKPSENKSAVYSGKEKNFRILHLPEQAV